MMGLDASRFSSRKRQSHGVYLNQILVPILTVLMLFLIKVYICWLVFWESRVGRLRDWSEDHILLVRFTRNSRVRWFGEIRVSVEIGGSSALHEKFKSEVVRGDSS
ncbi:unnamed protein product [Calypogeia fissa]